MTRTTLSQTADTVSSKWSNRLMTNLTIGWQRYQIYRRQKATVAKLLDLDERTLNDIGLKRSEIEQVVRMGREKLQQPYLNIGGVVSRG
jgi:uncharacterized protein YjiS (DUF1127 family)